MKARSSRAHVRRRPPATKAAAAPHPSARRHRHQSAGVGARRPKIAANIAAIPAVIVRHLVGLRAARRRLCRTIQYSFHRPFQTAPMRVTGARLRGHDVPRVIALRKLDHHARHQMDPATNPTPSTPRWNAAWAGAALLVAVGDRRESRAAILKSERTARPQLPHRGIATPRRRRNTARPPQHNGEVADLNDDAAARSRAKAADEELARDLPPIPNLPADECPLGRRRATALSCFTHFRLVAQTMRFHAENAHTIRRLARLHGFDDRAKLSRRALCGLRKAGAAWSRDRPVHARFAPSEHGYTK